MATEKFNNHHLSEAATAKFEAYLVKNEELQNGLTAFFDNNSDELSIIDTLREDRNELLDDLKKVLRAEVSQLDITTITKVVLGPFKVQKKWSSHYVVEQFVEIAQGCGMYDSAVAEGVIREVTQIDGKLAEEWLRKNSLTETFQVALDGKELTPAVSGPKEMPPLGSELK